MSHITTILQHQPMTIEYLTTFYIQVTDIAPLLQEQSLLKPESISWRDTLNDSELRAIYGTISTRSMKKSDGL